MLQTNQGQATRAPSQGPPSNAELQQQIRGTIQDAQQAARDAAIAGRDAAQAAREAAQARRGDIDGGPPMPPSMPGAYGGDPFNARNSFPPQVRDISIAFFVMCAVIIVGWPLARAFGKRIERRSEQATINPAMADQLQRIEQAVDAMSIEVERISESQRFMARLQNSQTPERAGLPADRS
ncbi:MAG: hypothetical protein ABIT20_24470 [Gemmatimonadaceae bacterium]